MKSSERLQALRFALKDEELQGYVIPVTDEFQGEYSANYARRVTWLTGFDGSAGIVIVLADKAALLVDGRYTLQAAREVDGALYEIHNSSEITPEAWLAANAPAPCAIGFDPWLHTPAQIERMDDILTRQGITLASLLPNLIDSLWQDQPPRPARLIVPLELEFAGKPHAEKRAELAGILSEKGAEALLITQPDALCWLLNIRGQDIPYNPLPLCYGIALATGNVILFTDEEQVDNVLVEHLGHEIEIIPIAELTTWLHALGHEGASVWVDNKTAPLACYQTLKEAHATLINATSPLTLARALKNPTEQEGIKRAHREDGRAVIALLHWIEITSADDELDELKIEQRLERMRATNPNYMGASFATIAGAGEHGAIVHYRANKHTNRALKKGEVLLLDSGGQYPYGTTDITRTTVRGGACDDGEFKTAFTAVLKGHIALAQARFPAGTSGTQLDVLARHALWAESLDYDHGTGHGVGHFLCVHEGPQRISKRGGDEPLRAGMVLSNEPGYYKNGEFGIRTENLMLVVERGTENGRAWLGFETLTLVPIDTRLVHLHLLSASERTWLNTYHQRVFDTHAEHLDADIVAWLRERCAAV